MEEFLDNHSDKNMKEFLELEQILDGILGEFYFREVRKRIAKF